MKPEDIERDLMKAVYRHLTKDEIEHYCGRKLDRITQARAEAHFKLCPLCDRLLTISNAEKQDMDDVEITAGDVALARRVISQMTRDGGPALAVGDGTGTLSTRIAGYLEQLMARWKAHFEKVRTADRDGQGGKEIWRWDSEDGVFKSWAVLEANTDLTIHLTLAEAGFEGTRIGIKLGTFYGEASLQRGGDTSSHAALVVPKRERPKKLESISIEIMKER